MANTRREGFNVRQGEKEEYIIQSITIEGDEYSRTNFLIDIRWEGVYLTERRTMNDEHRGRFYPSSDIQDISYIIPAPERGVSFNF